MRHILASAAAVLLATAPAHARDGDFYVAGEVGVVLAANSDLTFTPGGTPGSSGRADIDGEVGFDVAFLAGHDLGPIRLEAEVSRRSAAAAKIDSGFGIGSGGTVSLGEQDAAGRMKALSFMGNAMVDIGDETKLSFFVGGGAGYTKVTYDEVRRESGTGVLLADGDWRFAWQAIAGVRKPVSSALDVTLRYRLFNADGKSNLVGVSGRVVDDRFRSHSLMLGAAFNF